MQEQQKRRQVFCRLPNEDGVFSRLAEDTNRRLQEGDSLLFDNIIRIKQQIINSM